MPVMSAIEGAFCRSALWESLAKRVVLPWVLDGYPLSGEVLEIGGGSGAMASGVVHRFPDIHLTVTDVDVNMVKRAREVLSSHREAHVEVADVTALPFDTARFDVVTSYLMLHHVINWADALTEIGRVLKPGGVLIGYDLTNTRLARLIHTVDRSPHRILAADELSDGLTAAGFSAVHLRQSARDHLMRFHAVNPSRT